MTELDENFGSMLDAPAAVQSGTDNAEGVPLWSANPR
jgi:hypothetical protein